MDMRTWRLVTLSALLLASATGSPVLAGPGDAPPTPVQAPKPKAGATPAAAPAAGAAGSTTPKPAASPTAKDPDAAAIAFADAVDDALVKAVTSVQESSVTIWNLKKGPTGPPQRTSGGSGVFVSWKGQGPFVVSNEHVVRGADMLEIVTFDGSVYEAKLKDHVATYDIALLDFVGKKPKAYKAAKVGRSEALAEGQWVIATGNPFFLGGDGRCVATLGVISGLERFLRGDFTYAGAIQHDAEVNPGNSGGPLWNLSGEWIGINGMISTRGDGSGAGPSNTGASFAIPVHMILRYFDALMSDKIAASAGYLGIECSTSCDASGKPCGLKIESIRDDSPCKKGKPDPKVAVPEKGDVLVQVTLGSIGGTKSFDLLTANDLTTALSLYATGTKVRLKFLRAGKSINWSGELGGAAK